MDIYTGTCVFDFPSGDLYRDKLISLVSLGPHGTGPDVDIQSYPGATTAIISASMTSFGDEPTGAAVDGALMKMETHSFPGFPPANVLVIHAEIGVEAGNLHRLAYQITVLAQTREGGQELPGMTLTLVRIRKCQRTNHFSDRAVHRREPAEIYTLPPCPIRLPGGVAYAHSPNSPVTSSSKASRAAWGLAQACISSWKRGTEPRPPAVRAAASAYHARRPGIPTNR
jgi:hypothetical protein